MMCSDTEVLQVRRKVQPKVNLVGMCTAAACSSSGTKTAGMTVLLPIPMRSLRLPMR